MRTPRTIPLPTFTRVVATAATGLLLASTAAAGAQVLDRVPGGFDRPVVVAGSPAPAPPPTGLAGAVSDTASPAAEGAGSATSGGDEAAERQVEQERAAEKARERRAEQRRQVRGVQERLAELGWYDGDTDGVVGPATEQAVRGFQRASSLSVDGVAGPATRRALQDPDATTRAAWEASRPAPSTNSGTSGTSGSSGKSDTSPSASSGSSSSCDLQCRGRRIVDLAPLSAPPGYTIDVRPGRAGYLGMTHGAPRREIILWVRDGYSDRQMAATLLHEIGHAHDFEGLGGRGEDARRRWASTRGFSYQGRDAWFGNGCGSCSDYSIGAGDLAESVHACWAPGWDTFRSQLAGPPTSSQCDLLASVLR